MKTLKLIATLFVPFLLVACLAACSETPQAGEEKTEDPEFEAGFESGDTSEWSDSSPSTAEGGGEEADDEGGGPADEEPDP